MAFTRPTAAEGVREAVEREDINSKIERFTTLLDGTAVSYEELVLYQSEDCLEEDLLGNEGLPFAGEFDAENVHVDRLWENMRL